VRYRLTAPERYLLTRTSKTTIDDAIDALVEQLLDPGYSLPVQPALIAQRYGISVSMSHIDALGETRRTPDGHEIELRHDGERRQRFTFAHELAHVVLDERKRQFPKSAKLEQLCDRIAAALLMPQRDVLARIRQRSISELLQIQQDFDVSLQAAAVRFSALSGCAIFRAHIGKQPRPDITRLAGPLRAGEPGVLSTIERCLDERCATIAIIAHGGNQQRWSVEVASLANGDILYLFRRQHDIRFR
jgi:hypothetical protein